MAWNFFKRVNLYCRYPDLPWNTTEKTLMHPRGRSILFFFEKKSPQKDGHEGLGQAFGWGGSHKLREVLNGGSQTEYPAAYNAVH